MPDPARLKKGLWDTVNNRGKVSTNLLGPGDIVELVQGQATLLVVRVPRATRQQRPIFIGHNPLTGTFRRNDEGDYHCTEQEVGRMLADRAEDPADSRILERFTLDDLDLLSLQQYRHRFASHKPSHPWLSEDNRTLLAKPGGWCRDRASGVEGLTVAGLLMFGREESLREGRWTRYRLGSEAPSPLDSSVATSVKSPASSPVSAQGVHMDKAKDWLRQHGQLLEQDL